MKRSYSLVLTFLFFFQSYFSFDYELSRGKKMWSGSRHALHYLDHFKILNTKMDNIKGEVSSLYPFLFSTDWGLTFKLKVHNKPIPRKEGFMIMLSSQNPFESTIEEKKNKALDFIQTAVE